MEAEQKERAQGTKRSGIDFSQFLHYLPTFLFLVLLMTAFNCSVMEPRICIRCLKRTMDSISKSGFIVVISNIGAMLGESVAALSRNRSDARR